MVGIGDGFMLSGHVQPLTILTASHTAVMVQAPARGLSAGLLLTHDAWHPHWITLGPTPVKKDQEFARHRSAMVRLARGNAIGPSAERKPRIFHTDHRYTSRLAPRLDCIAVVCAAGMNARWHKPRRAPVLGLFWVIIVYATMTWTLRHPMFCGNKTHP